MQYVVTARQMQAMDRQTIDEWGLPGIVLMENAGRQVAHTVAELVAEECFRTDGNIVVICGGGNNGGDGYVAARWLKQWGMRVCVYLAVSADSVQGDARVHLDAYQRSGGTVESIATGEQLSRHTVEIHGAEIVLDCLLGVGITRPVTGHFAAIIGVVNDGVGRRVAVDIPSGLCADTGAVLGTAVKAQMTVAIAFLKPGVVGAPGFVHCGRVVVAEIGVSPQLAPQHSVSVGVLSSRDIHKLLPKIDPLAHKGRRGHVLVVGGSPGKRGAPRLAGWGALRGGAGLVTLAIDDSPRTGATPLPMMTTDFDCHKDNASSALRELSAGTQGVVLGPGMDTTPAGARLVEEALMLLTVPMVLDADALNHLAGRLSLIAQANGPVVLTPHPGEAARLLATTVAEIQRDRIAAAAQIATEGNCVVVLKGARTVIFDGRTAPLRATRAVINRTGNPGLATAGSGDVLAGLIAALIAQGLDFYDASVAGVHIHGFSADLCARRMAMHGICAGDIVDEIPRAMAEISS